MPPKPRGGYARDRSASAAGGVAPPAEQPQLTRERSASERKAEQPARGPRTPSPRIAPGTRVERQPEHEPPPAPAPAPGGAISEGVPNARQQASLQAFSARAAVDAMGSVAIPRRTDSAGSMRASRTDSAGSMRATFSVPTGELPTFLICSKPPMGAVKIFECATEEEADAEWKKPSFGNTYADNWMKWRLVPPSDGRGRRSKTKLETSRGVAKAAQKDIEEAVKERGEWHDKLQELMDEGWERPGHRYDDGKRLVGHTVCVQKLGRGNVLGFKKGGVGVQGKHHIQFDECGEKSIALERKGNFQAPWAVLPKVSTDGIVWQYPSEGAVSAHKQSGLCLWCMGLC